MSQIEILDSSKPCIINYKVTNFCNGSEFFYEKDATLTHLFGTMNILEVL